VRRVAWVVFFEIFASDFCYRTVRVLQHEGVRMRISAFGIVPREGLWYYRSKVRLSLIDTNWSRYLDRFALLSGTELIRALNACEMLSLFVLPKRFPNSSDALASGFMLF
jgi:hypothetical protein